MIVPIQSMPGARTLRLREGELVLDPRFARLADHGPASRFAKVLVRVPCQAGAGGVVLCGQRRARSFERDGGQARQQLVEPPVNDAGDVRVGANLVHGIQAYDFDALYLPISTLRTPRM